MYVRLSVDEMCKDKWTCPSVWADQDQPDELVIVGHPVPEGTVPTADGEVAIRIRRSIVADAGIS